MSARTKLRPEPPAHSPQCDVVTDAEQIRDRFAAYLHDESKLTAPAVREIAFPKSTDDVSAILARRAAERTPTTVSGARTGITGASVAVDGSAVLALDRMKGIEPPERVSGEWRVRVMAGTTLAELNEYLSDNAPDGARAVFPVDPTETWAALGGMVATNASGARSFAYGAMRNWVTALTVVLADGSRLKLRRGDLRVLGLALAIEDSWGERELTAAPLPKPATKNTIGYPFSEGLDVIDLFIGQEGTLGVVTEIELRLIEAPPSRLSYLQLFESDDAALLYVERLRRARGVTVLAIEYADRRSLELARESPAMSSSPIARLVRDGFSAMVYTEIPLADESALESVFEQVSSLVVEAGADIADSYAGTDDREVRELKAFRHAIPEQINATIARRKAEHPGLHKVATDMAVPDAHLREMYFLYRSALDSAGLDYAIFGHAGDNHFHVNMLPRDQEELDRGKALYRTFAEEAVRRGGAVAAEHGIGRLKKDFLRIQYGLPELETLLKIRRFFDPHGLLNRGVLFDADG